MEQFGPYRLLAPLGRGGMGEVWRALDTRKDREVALKVLGGWLGADPGFAARFRREASLAARLNAPHILPIHDYGEIDGRFFIDMPLIDGIDLDAVIARDGPLPPARAVALVGQVADALDAAHDADLLHRDVKPSNVLLVDRHGRSDFAYLIDFGIARAASGTKITTTGRELGTLAYMAPERFGGDSDRRGDVYALACLLHTLLTGQAPFVAPPGAHELGFYVNAHLNLPPPRASELAAGVPRALDAVIARGMAKQPSDRPDTAGALAGAASAALMEALTAEPADDRVPPPTPETGPVAVITAPATEVGEVTRADVAVAETFVPPAPATLRPAATTAPGPTEHAPAAPPTDAAPRKRVRTVRFVALIAALLVVSVIVFVATRRDPSTQPPAPATAAPTATAPPTAGPTTATPVLAVGGEIAVKTGPLDSIAAATDGRTAWASEPDLQGTGTFLHRIDTSTWTTTGTYPIPERALDLAVAPDGSRVYLTGESDGVLQVFDVATHAVVAKVPVGSDPTGAAVSADGRFAYTSGGTTGNHVQIVDTAMDKVVADVDVGAAVNGIFARGDALIVGTAKGVVLLDGATGQRRGEIAVTGYLGAVSPDGRTGYSFTDRAGQFVELDLPGRRIVNTVQLDGLETPVGFSADGASAYFSRSGSPRSIAVVDVVTNRVTRTVALPDSFSGAQAVSPDGRLVYGRGPGLGSVVVVRVA